MMTGERTPSIGETDDERDDDDDGDGAFPASGRLMPVQYLLCAWNYKFADCTNQDACMTGNVR